MRAERISRAPLPWKDWKLVLKGVWEELTVDNVDVLAGGIAFYAFLSLFPTLALLVLLYGLFGDPMTLEKQLTWITVSLIPAARDVLSESLRLAAVERATFGIGAVIAFFAASWTASRATNALLLSAQVAYDDTKQRSFLEQTRLNLFLTFGALGVGAVLLGSLGAAPGLLERTGLSELARRTILLLRWPLILGVVYLAIGQIYRVAPRGRKKGPPRTIAPGALVATVAWMIVSLGFNFYASSFGNYGGTYGALATVVVLLTWFFLSAYVFIIGAEINAEIDRVRRGAGSVPATSRGMEKRSAPASPSPLRGALHRIFSWFQSDPERPAGGGGRTEQNSARGEVEQETPPLEAREREHEAAPFDMREHSIEGSPRAARGQDPEGAPLDARRPHAEGAPLGARRRSPDAPPLEAPGEEPGSSRAEETPRVSFDSLGEELAEKMLDSALGGSAADDEDEERDPSAMGMHVIRAKEPEDEEEEPPLDLDRPRQRTPSTHH